MTHHTHEEKTAGGILGRVVGKAKELVGGRRGRDDLAREGRPQQAESEAGREAAEAERGAGAAEATASVEEEQGGAAELRQKAPGADDERAGASDPEEER